MKNNLHSKISKILERDCGLTCPNGAERNKPSLKAILALIKKHERGLIREIEGFYKFSKELPYGEFREGHQSAIEYILAKLKDPNGPKEIEK